MSAGDGGYLREITPERLVSLQKFHRDEARRLEAEAKFHKRQSDKMLDEIDRRVKARKAAG